MKVENIDVNEAISEVKKLLKEDKNVSPGLAAAVNVILLVVTILCNRLGLNSRNSSKPPSTDNKNNGKDNDNDDDDSKKNPKKKKGGQNGHIGRTLNPVDNPDEIKEIKVDRKSLPKGNTYTPDGYVMRQEFNIKISRFVTEYRAEKIS
jgi:transposase